jgi:hypothetical protein
MVLVCLSVSGLGCAAKKPQARVAGPVAQAGAAEASDVDPTSERLGGIGVGDAAELAVDTFGEPASKSEPMEMGATGETVSSWSWPKHGLTIVMVLDAEAQSGTVSSMTVTAPSTITTSRGVGIGTPRADVDRIYAPFFGVGREPDEPDTTSPESLIIGSVYGGTFFTFAAGKVTEIFVGAGAE